VGKRSQRADGAAETGTGQQDAWLTLAEAAGRLGVSTDVLGAWVDEGHLETSESDGQRVTCDRWLTACLTSIKAAPLAHDGAAPAPQDVQAACAPGMGGLAFYMLSGMPTKEMSPTAWEKYAEIMAVASAYPGSAQEALAVQQGPRALFDPASPHRTGERKDMADTVARRAERREDSRAVQTLEASYEQVKWKFAQRVLPGAPDLCIVWCIENCYHPVTWARVPKVKGWSERCSLMQQYGDAQGVTFGDEATARRQWRERLTQAKQYVRLIALAMLANPGLRRSLWELGDSGEIRTAIAALKQKWMGDCLKSAPPQKKAREHTVIERDLRRRALEQANTRA